MGSKIPRTPDGYTANHKGRLCVQYAGPSTPLGEGSFFFQLGIGSGNVIPKEFLRLNRSGTMELDATLSYYL